MGMQGSGWGEDADEAAAWVFCGGRWYLPDVPQNKELAVQTSPDPFLLRSTYSKERSTHAFPPSVPRRGSWGFPGQNCFWWQVTLLSLHPPSHTSFRLLRGFLALVPWRSGEKQQGEAQHGAAPPRQVELVSHCLLWCSDLLPLFIPHPFFAFTTQISDKKL